MSDQGFQEIRYKGKRVKRDGFTGKMKAISVAVEHNADGSVTVCKEIADSIFDDERIPQETRKYFDTTPLFVKLQNEGFGNLKPQV